MNRRGLLGISIVVAVLIASTLWMVVKARAHGWYDAECCSGHDCEPVSNVSFVASDPGTAPVMVVTTSLGTKPLTNQTKIRESKDSRMHACIYQGALLCLYMPPGN
jgi:hypothetical protein